MEFKHTRGNILILFEDLSILPILIIFISIILLKSNSINYQTLIPVLLLVIHPFLGISKYFTTYYTMDENHLIVETGIFHKKRMELPLTKITTVDLSQNILYQIFDTYKISIDNGSQTIDTRDKAEIILALKTAKAMEFKQIVMRHVTIDKSGDEKNIEFKASSWDLIKLGLLQSKIKYFFKGGPVVVPIIIALAVFVSGLSSSDELLDKIFDQNNAVIVLLFIILFFYIVSLGVSLISVLFTYYDYKLSGSADSLTIKYGLLNKKKYTFPINKINGILISQNLLMGLFRCYTTSILVIGYGDNSNDDVQEQAVLFPIASMEKIKIINNELLPGFDSEYFLQKPYKKAIRYFFCRAGLIMALLIFIIALITENIYLITPAAGLMIIALISVILQYRNAGIFCSIKNVVITFGGYHKKIALIKTASIESVSAKGSIFKRKNNIISIRIGFMAPLRSANLNVLNVPMEQYFLLQKVLKY